MIAFDPSGLNQNVLGGGIPVNLTGFVPSVTLVNTWGTHIVFTDASAFPSGDTFGKINIEVSDQHGGTVLGVITAASGTATLATDSTKLNQTDTYTIKVTVTSTLGCIADGMVMISNANATGALASYATSFTTTVF